MQTPKRSASLTLFISLHSVAELLSLSDNDIAFAIRDDIGFMSNLKSLQLSNTYISGTLPSAMAELTALSESHAHATT